MFIRGLAKSVENKKLILVVDDDIINIQLLKNLLDSQYSVITATNGIEAIDSVVEQHPDLIILDIMMPGMDGVEVFQQLKKNPQVSDIPVIFLTSKNTEKDEVDALQIGAVDYIVKPFSPNVVLQRVAKQIEIVKKLKSSAKISKTNGEKYFDLQKQIKDILNLTDAEARLANSLVNGLTLEEIAQNTGLKYNTLKGYLKVIFQKTNTKKQHELVSYILKNFV